MQVSHSRLADRPLSRQKQAHYLMCPPQHFAVSYSINPWMDPSAWTANAAFLADESARQWQRFYEALLATGAEIELVKATPDLPDLVFTANAAVVLDSKALLARFRYPERRGEEPVFARALHNLKLRGALDHIAELPGNLILEGSGDCIWDRTRNFFWLGYGQRSDLESQAVITDLFGVDCVPLELADPHFYHLDTALCVLPFGEVIFYPAAFTSAGLDPILERIHPFHQIPLGHDDARRFAANLVSFGRYILMANCSQKLRRQLEEIKYTVIETPLDAFYRSGGSACCLTLRTDHTSFASCQGTQLGTHPPLH